MLIFKGNRLNLSMTWAMIRIFTNKERGFISYHFAWVDFFKKHGSRFHMLLMCHHYVHAEWNTARASRKIALPSPERRLAMA